MDCVSPMMATMARSRARHSPQTPDPSLQRSTRARAHEPLTHNSRQTRPQILRVLPHHEVAVKQRKQDACEHQEGTDEEKHRHTASQQPARGRLPLSGNTVDNAAAAFRWQPATLFPGEADTLQLPLRRNPITPLPPMRLTHP
ncbi:hypothetical protein Vretimale_3011 [Volvox reticuliferus]|uniref:Uncharacterized protein n=1 Tax=Volvox reticuliferus TaxID=1737510 RepID=A0A8J4D8S0_9CHLO|nr:hypothetical protein Vretimale_3011 [Volvox reticuliferus]